MSDERRNNSSLLWLQQQLSGKETIINGISDVIMLLDAKTYQILDVNKAFLDLYRVRSGQVLGRTCHEITHHLSRPCSQFPGHELCPLEESVSKGTATNAGHVHKDRDGRNLYFEITAYPLKDQDGSVNRIIHLSRDVTDRRRAEKALQERVKQSENMASLGQLMAEIIHEIKNPLMMIGGFAQQLFQPADEHTKVKKLTIITEQVARLEKLISDLREYYRPGKPTDETANVNGVLEKIHSLVANECARHNIRTHLAMKEEALMVGWDPNILEQVLLNVIKNAIEAMEKGGTLSIGAELSGDQVRVTIEDDGCGIPKKHMDKILECFFTTKSYGTGLGLCIAKRFIDEHEGSHFSLESEEGKGTTVRIILPALVALQPRRGLAQSLRGRPARGREQKDNQPRERRSENGR